MLGHISCQLPRVIKRGSPNALCAPLASDQPRSSVYIFQPVSYSASRLTNSNSASVRAFPACEISHIASYLPLEGLKREESSPSQISKSVGPTGRGHHGVRQHDVRIEPDVRYLHWHVRESQPGKDLKNKKNVIFFLSGRARAVPEFRVPIRSVPAFESSRIATCLPLEGLKRELSDYSCWDA
jgi:hypothetical protein